MSDVRDIKQLLVRLNFGEPGATDSKMGAQSLAALDELILLYPSAYQTDDVVWVVDQKSFYTIDMTNPASPVYTVFSTGGAASNVTFYYGTENDIKLYKEGDNAYSPSNRGYNHGDAILCARDLAISGFTDIIALDLYEIAINGGEFYNYRATLKGTTGAGVPSGGTTEQVLFKSSATDFDTAWDNLTLQKVTNGGATTTTTLTAADFILGSDRRLKDNIKPYKAKKVPIKFRSFTLKSNGMSQVGVIADELEETNPEFVVKGKYLGTDSVQYISLMMAKIAELESRLKKLE
jgi:hypothetical protein